MQIKNHLLYLDTGKQAAFSETKNFGKTIQPIYIILHYTAGDSASNAINWFKNPQSQASAHFVIGRDGSITQMVATNRRAWHAGTSRWGELTDINTYSVGIEIVNAGKLNRRSDGQWLTWSKLVMPETEVTIATHKRESSPTGWHEYAEQQIEAVISVGSAIAAKYGIVDVLGHDDIAPTRKVDPGPLFPMSSVQSRILGREV